MTGAVEPIPPEVRELYDYLIAYAQSGRLGLLSTLDKETGATRFTLFGQHPLENGDFTLVPLGFLSTTAGEEVIPPGLTPVIALEPERFEEFALAREIEIDRWADDGGSC